MAGLAASEPAGGSRTLPKLGLRFALVYLAIAAALFSIYGFPFELFGARSDWLAGYLRLYAKVAGSTLRLFDPSVVVSGDRIDGRFALQIVRNCDAIEVNILFVSAILAFPAPWLRRSIALIAGLAALVLANIARICLLYCVGVYRPTWFATAHEEILPLVLIAFTALSFIGWASYLTGSGRARGLPVPGA
ncbi:MAG TPA: archaeosortase/exosortase family protein [Polyangiaceae bacterium]|nr:archaeosortase/exosortase family protein [Polyangiaceae bacterium]